MRVVGRFVSMYEYGRYLMSKCKYQSRPCFCGCTAYMSTNYHAYRTPAKGRTSKGARSSPLPRWIVACDDRDCRIWKEHRKGPAPMTHYHCGHPACPKQGRFCATWPADAVRHTASHATAIMREHTNVRKLLEHIRDTSDYMCHKVHEDKLSAFRKRVHAHNDSAGTGSAASWRQRLLIGKAGPTGDQLSSAIERFGVVPACAVFQRIPHAPNTAKPAPGHVVKFNPAKGDENTWYGLCCGTFDQRTVFGDQGLACSIQWLDVSHHGFHKNKKAVFYELMEFTQYQLVETMQDWGDLLYYDAESSLYILIEDDESASESDDFDHGPVSVSPPTGSTSDGEGLTRSMKTAGVEPEELHVCNLLFPRRDLWLVDDDGSELSHPEVCPGTSPGCAGPCLWTTKSGRLRLLPIISRSGPIFLQPRRYICSTHKKEVETTSEQVVCGPYNVSTPYFRLGDMKYEASFLVELQSMYVDTLSVESCRRRILDAWTGHAIGQLTTLKQQQHKLGLRSGHLAQASKLLVALADFVPSHAALTDLQLLLFQRLVKPAIPAYDEAVAAFDGQVIKLDGTMKVASTIIVNEPTRDKQGSAKRHYKKVGSAVLVFIGAEGLNLRTPTLVPAENNKSIKKGATEILKNRRKVLGSLSAPAVFTSDFILRTHAVLWECVCKVYPELAAANDGIRTDDTLLMLQDILHRQWAFTVKGVSKKHVDYSAYEEAMKDVFNQLRVDVKASGECAQLYADRERDWRRTLPTDTAGPAKKLRTSILQGHEATEADDTYTRRVLETLGNGAPLGLRQELGSYVPRTVCIRTCRRMLMTPEEIRRTFPDHGYEDGGQFMQNLQGVIDFFQVCVRTFEPASLYSEWTDITPRTHEHKYTLTRTYM